MFFFFLPAYQIHFLCYLWKIKSFVILSHLQSNIFGCYFNFLHALLIHLIYSIFLIIFNNWVFFKTFMLKRLTSWDPFFMIQLQHLLDEINQLFVLAQVTVFHFKKTNFFLALKKILINVNIFQWIFTFDFLNIIFRESS